MQLVTLTAALGALFAVTAIAQTPASLPYVRTPSTIDSGYLNNSSGDERVVFRRHVHVDRAIWLQFEFGSGTSLPTGSFLRMTSMFDGAVQRHDGLTIAEWDHVSAAFNGDQVMLELVAGPKTVGNRVVLDSVLGGQPTQDPQSICGPTDDRVLSSDPRQGRLFVGCTGWMIGADVMLTAGHCISAGGTRIIEFNVPLSTAGGTVVRAHPDDQYPFTNLNFIDAGVGTDWAVNRVGPNSNHGLLPTQRNGGQWYALGSVPGSTAGQNIRITGYGSTSTPVSPTWYLVQKTHLGSLSQINATSLCYATDTTGGNSGSPIIHENTGAAIGIHTHSGCTSTGGCNQGTRIDRSDLQNAIAAAAPTRALFTTYGRGCPTPLTFYELFATGNAHDLSGRSFLLTPTASGGWSVANCTTNCFETGFTNNLGLTDDQLATNQSLGFSFPLTGIGGSTTAIDIDSNGWIGLVAGQFGGSDFSETVSEFLAQPARLAVLWDDLNPGAAGGVYFDRFPGKAVVTWSQVPEYSNTGSNTFQAQLFANGNIILSFQSITSADNLVGLTSGNGVTDPGATNLSSAVPFTTGAGGTPLSLAASAAPVLGTSIDLTVASLPGSTASAFLNLGFAQTSLPLDPIGMAGCWLLTTLDVTSPMTLQGGGTARAALPIPNLPSLVGGHLFAQSLAIAPGSNQLGVVASNGGDLRLGN